VACSKRGEAARVLETPKSDSNRAYDNYEAMISKTGPDGENPRTVWHESWRGMNLPSNIYTQMVIGKWTCTKTLFHFPAVCAPIPPRPIRNSASTPMPSATFVAGLGSRPPTRPSGDYRLVVRDYVQYKLLSVSAGMVEGETSRRYLLA